MLWAYVIGGLLVPATFVSDIWLDIDYQLAADVSLIVVAVLVNAFTALYGFRSKWRTNRIGGVYLIKCIALSLFLLQATASVWWNEDYPFRQQIRFVIYAYAALVYIPMVITLWREQQRDRREVTGPPLPF
ncbi:hypothetical protein CG716_09745 [Mycolicibacterium sphagni]|uniref:Uncharacterized protein n=1 Tax=Mycolicibacterium sphagni TaxID=1786 RepID=A0A255DM05_9MYCO|nr:hypothetical protein CG716_09745 [Mycolicibacterium sphagni]